MFEFMHAQYLKNISADRVDSVLEALKMAFGSVTPTEFTLLAGGYSSSQVYKVVIKDKTAVLRVMGLDQSLADRSNQIACLKIAAAENLAPAYYYDNAEAGIIIMNYIECKKREKTNTELLQLTGMLKQLHALQNFPAVHQPIFDYMDNLVHKIKAYEASSLIMDYFGIIKETKILLQKYYEYTACHNDLYDNNILFNGERLYLIDWEAAGVEDPYFDLATLCNELVSSEAQEDYFLQEYFGGKLTEYQNAKLVLMKQIACCYAALHFLDFAAADGMSLKKINNLDLIPTLKDWDKAYSLGQRGLNTKEDFLLYALVQIKHSLQQISSDQFVNAKKTL